MSSQALIQQYKHLINTSQAATAVANAFDLRWQTRDVYHYDAFFPQWPPRDPEKPVKIGPRKASELMMKLQTNIAPQIFTNHGVFDGRKNIFSWVRYELTEATFQVPMDRANGHNVKIVVIEIKFVKAVNVGVLDKIREGNKAVAEQASEALNMLNMSVQAYPRSNTDFLTKGAAFYIAQGKSDSAKVAPFQLWHGFTQTVRLTIRGLILNVNSTVGIVVPKLSLQDLALTYLRRRQPRELDRLQHRDPEFMRLNQVMKVLLVHPTYGKSRRPRKVEKLVEKAGGIVFENSEGRAITVSEHFRSTYNIEIRPDELGVGFKGSRNVIPISCLETEQQLFNSQASPELIREILSFIPQNPEKRLQAIRNGWQHLGLNSSEFLQGAGISVNPQPKPVDGRLLPRPTLLFGQEVANERHEGTWDVMRKKLHSPVAIGSWCVVDFSGSRDPSVIDQFSMDLGAAMHELGIVKSHPGPQNPRGLPLGAPQVFHESPRGIIPRILFERGSAIRAELMVIILPDPAADIYHAVKHWGDVTQGVVTQCVRWSRKISDGYNARKQNQYHNNLILKINAKLLGRSFVPQDASMDFFRSAHTMILGADVSHPAPQSTFPSIASVVASVDRFGTKYTARIEIQRSRLEIIQNMEGMVYECLESFFGANGTAPQRIIFYRDGVSEGEFETVLRTEVQTSLLGAVKRFYQEKKAPGLPALTFIVVTKRHHMRFIPSNPQNTDKSRNCKAGFVVEDDLRRPLYNDFYLQSQAGLKGTSIPGHYTILHDDIYIKSFGGDKAMAKKAIEQFTYTLCHSYSRATRSVKIPAPVYYADLVCRRGKFHFENLDIDNMSVASSGNTERDRDRELEAYRQHFKPLHNNMKQKMFFM